MNALRSVSKRTLGVDFGEDEDETSTRMVSPEDNIPPMLGESEKQVSLDTARYR